MLNPITFSIPNEKIIKYLPNKTKLLAHIIPGVIETYIYDNEKDYYKDYQESYFAITKKKAGWDCLRHYEILANGCIPYFIDIDKCPQNTMSLLPKKLLLEGNKLYESLKNKTIDEMTILEKNRCNKLIIKLLNYTKKHLSTDKIAKYILDKTNNIDVKKILFLSGCIKPDYLRCLTLHGFKKLLGNNCHDYPKIPHIYNSETIDYKNLYGKGITYTNLLEQGFHNESLNYSIQEDIMNHKYDLIIYGSYHRGMPFYNFICNFYDKKDIILLDGEDNYSINHLQFIEHPIFIRELP